MSTALQTVALTADPEVILAYGELTDDMNPIHIDPVYAAGTAMGGCIAHGTMSICLLWQSLFRTFGESASRRVDLDVRFIKPVRAGETIHAGGELLAGQADCYTVWVRGDDGVDRVTGTVRLLHEEALA
ncbi:MAG: MaoC family dehydratase [Hydrogenophaga sp.]|jgi:3-hydroxybutyryl-CoA dehydratase|uniref:MaoC family dehydratase n=1 Tax=Hydrogenophaga sp. TaxID=1904254 RepID=UPI002626DFB5|nr:MaoC family dehydratase [Hydrogenophaga sp.]MCW5672185.1 MaoC family dehydratase [Hydrogenophaga sp.]